MGAEGDAQAQTFIDPETGNAYAVVINDDLHEVRAVTIRVGESVEAVRDIVHGQDIPLEKDFAGGSSTGTVQLDAGAGTIVAIEEQSS